MSQKNQMKRTCCEKLETALTPAAAALEKFCKIFSGAGMIVFMAMVCLTFTDVFMRYVFHNSFNGTVELTELFMVIVVFSSLAYAQWTKDHVIMDILIQALKPRWKDMLEGITLVWCIAVAILGVYATVRYGQKTTSTTGILNIPLSPFIYFVSFGFFTLFLTLCWNLVRSLAKISRNGRWDVCLCLAIALLCVLAAWDFAQHRITGMSSSAIGVCGIIAMFVLFITGMPVGFALMATGFIFSGMLRGLAGAMNMYGKAMFATSASYAWSPLMFFMLMGYFCFYGNFGKDIYICARRWLGHMRGGLAQGTVCACAAFGAVVGDVLSGSIAMSAIALPEMRKAGYNDELAVGTLACSSTIGALIPPSAYFILFGVLAEQSIADLFMAGVIPGILCTLCFMAAIWFMVWRNPGLAPVLPKVSLVERLESLKSAIPIMAIFIIVIGGIYGGIFTPTEGGGIGAGCTFLLCLILRRLSWKNFMESLNASARFITMCFTVLTGAAALAAFITLSRIPQSLADVIATSGMPGWMSMGAIIVAMLVLGCFIPAMPLLLVCVPIFVPIALVFHWNLIWFGVIMTLMINMAGITPPFGINLFVMKGLAGVSLSEMFRSSVPFVIALSICIILVLAFPQTCVWLPSALH